MGCQSIVALGDSLTFAVCTHTFATGVLTDADAVPPYRIYEDETATPILTGDTAKLDDSNTTGFYTEKIACTAANGFEIGKSYTIYIEETVAGVKIGETFGFTVVQPGLRKNAALAKFSFVMRDSTTHMPVTGKTVAATRSLDGAAFAAGTLSAVSEVSGGVYYVDFAAADMNAAVVVLKCTATGCDDTIITLLTNP